MKKKIEYYQFEELNKKVLFINKYDLSFMYLYELNRYWKEFLFDLLDEIVKKKTLILYEADNLLTYLKNNYEKLIKENNLTIDFKDYVELNDYITFDEWIQDDNNHIQMDENGIFLIK